jgi:hypothetical protein
MLTSLKCASPTPKEPQSTIEFLQLAPTHSDPENGLLKVGRRWSDHSTAEIQSAYMNRDRAVKEADTGFLVLGASLPLGTTRRAQNGNNSHSSHQEFLPRIPRPRSHQSLNHRKRGAGGGEKHVQKHESPSTKTQNTEASALAHPGERNPHKVPLSYSIYLPPETSARRTRRTAELGHGTVSAPAHRHAWKSGEPASRPLHLPQMSTPTFFASAELSLAPLTATAARSPLALASLQGLRATACSVYSYSRRYS